MPEQQKDYSKDPRFPIYRLKVENHWREHRPRHRRALKADGKWEARVTGLVTSALEHMDILRAAGEHEDVIREIVLRQYIYLPEEP